MKKRNLILCLAACLIALGVGVFLASMLFSGFVPPFSVTGDVNEVLKIQKISEIGTVRTMQFQSKSYRVVPLADLLAKAKPSGMEEIDLVAGDGFTAVLKAGDIDGSYLSFTSKNGWEVLNPDLPPSSNAKMISEINVVGKADGQATGFLAVSGQKSVRTTVGRLYAGPLLSYPYFEGQASVEKNGADRSDSIYTRRRVFRLQDILSLAGTAKVMLLGETGGVQLADSGGYYELKGNYINYIQPETRETMERVCCAVINPPAAGITDVYYDASHYLEDRKKVLIVLVDGLNYEQFKSASNKGCTPFLRGKTAAAMALGVYPLEKNVWLSAMLTGQSPADNGVKSKKDTKPSVETLFDENKNLGKKAALLADKDLLSVAGEATAKSPSGGGKSDAGVFDQLKSGIKGDNSLVVAEFTSVLQNSKMYGVSSEQTLEAIKQMDSYIRALASGWDGKIIVTALPSGDAGGGLPANAADLFVPYLLF